MKLFTKMVEVAFVELDGEEFKWSEVVDVLNGLEETDSFMDHILIDNEELADVLEAREVLSRNARGAQFKGPKFQPFRDELFNLKIES